MTSQWRLSCIILRPDQSSTPRASIIKGTNNRILPHGYLLPLADFSDRCLWNTNPNKPHTVLMSFYIFRLWPQWLSKNRRSLRLASKVKRSWGIFSRTFLQPSHTLHLITLFPIFLCCFSMMCRHTNFPNSAWCESFAIPRWAKRLVLQLYCVPPGICPFTGCFYLSVSLPFWLLLFPIMSSSSYQCEATHKYEIQEQVLLN